MIVNERHSTIYLPEIDNNKYSQDSHTVSFIIVFMLRAVDS